MTALSLRCSWTPNRLRTCAAHGRSDNPSCIAALQLADDPIIKTIARVATKVIKSSANTKGPILVLRLRLDATSRSRPRESPMWVSYCFFSMLRSPLRSDHGVPISCRLISFDLWEQVFRRRLTVSHRFACPLSLPITIYEMRCRRLQKRNRSVGLRALERPQPSFMVRSERSLPSPGPLGRRLV